MGTCVNFAPRMNDNPAASIAWRLASDTMPGVGDDGDVAELVRLLERGDRGDHRRVSALLPSNASTINGNPAASVSRPMVICGSSRRSFEIPRLTEPVTLSVSKYSVDTSYRTRDAGPSAACFAHAAANRCRQVGSA